MTLTWYGLNKWLLVVGFCLTGLIALNVCAGEPSVIELKDGSVITGEVVSFDGKVWTLKSGSMGIIKIDGAKIVSIHSKNAAGQEPAGGLSGGATVNSSDIQSMQQSIMANEQLMAMIMSMQNDPEVQAILQDPEVMKAVNAGDVNALLGNPKFRKLMENSKIRAITREAAKE